MGKLCMTLPPFSPDYSGVCSTMFPFDAITVIHDASGCTGNYTGYDEPRWFHSRAPIYCSGLREIDAILGDDEKLVQKVLYALEDVKPEMIALVGSPVPMVIGADMEGIAAEIENRTGIMTFGFSTTGLRYYPQGIQMVYKKVVQRILEENDWKLCEKLENSVNIIGATPIDFGRSTTLEDLEQFLVENGLNINVSLWKEVKKADIARLKNASCNIIVSHAGVELAKYMEKHYGIPYVTGLPFGEKYSEIWVDELKNTLTKTVIGEQDARLEKVAASEKESSILVIGEQFQSNSIRNAIEAECDMTCDVAGICGWNSDFARENDCFLESEEEIERILNDDKYDLIIGDPLYKGLLRSEKEFYEYSHYAVSSKLGNGQAKSLIGKNVII